LTFLNHNTEKKKEGGEINWPYNENFLWNHHLMLEFYHKMQAKSWALPVIHGYMKELRFETVGGRISILFIARRSRHFAGT
jgi:phosphatidylinositol 3,5-bisphosphate 5-phosphatase